MGVQNAHSLKTFQRLMKILLNRLQCTGGTPGRVRGWNGPAKCITDGSLPLIRHIKDDTVRSTLNQITELCFYTTIGKFVRYWILYNSRRKSNNDSEYCLNIIQKFAKGKKGYNILARDMRPVNFCFLKTLWKEYCIFLCWINNLTKNLHLN